MYRLAHSFIRLWHNIVHSMLASGICVLVLVLLILQAIYHSLPNIDDGELFIPRQSFIILDKNNTELYRFYDQQDRTLVRNDELPEHLIHAIVAIEDKRFFTRSCVDIRAIGRALYANLSSYKSEGASTITQQLIRTALLHRGKTVERKLREMMLACQMESRYTKDEIINHYVNWISFGHGIAGVQQASRRYFGKEAKDLSIAQSAVIAALPQRPTYFSPYGPHRRTTLTEQMAERIRNKEISSVEEITQEDIVIGLIGTNIRIGDSLEYIAGRSDVVLYALFNQGYITSEQYIAAESELRAMDFSDLKLTLHAPHFVLTLKEELEQWAQSEMKDSKQSGVILKTTLDLNLQKVAEDIIDQSLETLGSEYNGNDIALIAVDPRDNNILAYVGGPNFYDKENGQIDMVRIPRQMGSSFKPFVYAALFEKGYSSESVIHDRPLDPKIYRPHRSGYYGRMTIRTALSRSRNVPAIRAFYLAGGEDVLLNMAERVGIGTPKWYKQSQRPLYSRFQYGWPLALGSAEASLLEMTQGYSVLRRNGAMLPITGVAEIQNQFGTVLFKPERKESQAMLPQIATSIDSILKDQKARETDWQVAMDLPFAAAAIKTGTSNLCKQRDVYGSCKEIYPNNTWTLGYTDDIIVGVWVGNVDNAPMKQDTAAFDIAFPIWKRFIVTAHEAGFIHTTTSR